MKNPFLEYQVFPDFANITPQAAAEAMPLLAQRARARIAELEEAAARDDTAWGTVLEISEATRLLWRAWGIVTHETSVMNSPEWREVEEKHQPEVIALGLAIAQSKAFCALYKRLAGEEKDPVRRRILECAVRDAELSGVALEGEKKERFNEIQTRLGKLATDFSNCVLDATKAWKMPVAKADEARLEGLPAHIKAMVANADGEGWTLTIEDAVYVPAMKHLKDAGLRESLFRARATRAPENTQRIAEILALKQEEAELLGYGNFAEVSLATKCAPSVKAVMEMIDEMAAAAKPAEAKEDAALEEFAGKRLELWDRTYYAERLRERDFAYSEEELAQYFNFEDVIAGLFALAKRLFGIDVEKADGEAAVWHPDVRFFRIKENGRTVAHFYLDPYSRPATKLGGAWMNSFETLRDGGKVLPLALMVCNQSLPGEDGKCLMNFREVETLFHEFGHALQHTLTRVTEEGASGLNLIEWDAVELASQFMENWCVDERTLKSFARHAKTGEAIPRDLLLRVKAARNFRAGAATCRQLAFAKTDLLLHSGPLGQGRSAEDVKREVFEDFMPGCQLPQDRFLESFTHIFSGGYSAGYYSYKWSEVMSADAFGAFEEAGLDDEEKVQALGRKYRESILANGGAQSALETFKEFRGHAPSPAALLRQQGLA